MIDLKTILNEASSGSTISSEILKVEPSEVLTLVFIIKKAGIKSIRYSKTMTLDDVKDTVSKVKNAFSSANVYYGNTELTPQDMDAFIQVYLSPKEDDKADLKKSVILIGQSLSAAKAIIKNIPSLDKAKCTYYLTGAIWHKNIEKFNDFDDMKNFNSSDFVIELSKDNFYGISLKKKLTPTMDNPPLSNVSLRKVYSKITQLPKGDDIMDDFDKIFNNYYTDLLKKNKDAILNRLGKSTVATEAVKKPSGDPVAPLSPNEKQKIAKKIDGLDRNSPDWKKIFTSYLIKGSHNKAVIRPFVNSLLANKTNSSNIFNKLDKLIQEYKLEFIAAIFSLIFKKKLLSLKDFDFALVVGDASGSVGEFTKITTMINLIDLIRKSSKNAITLSKLKSDGQSNAASLTYIVSIGAVSIARIVIRYKGNFAASPEILGYTTPEFSNLVATPLPIVKKQLKTA